MIRSCRIPSTFTTLNLSPESKTLGVYCVFQDFQFRQMKKAKVFEPSEDLPKERSSLLIISNKFGLTFVGLDKTFKVYKTQDILNAVRVDGNVNEIGMNIIIYHYVITFNFKHTCMSIPFDSFKSCSSPPS